MFYPPEKVVKKSDSVMNPHPSANASTCLLKGSGSSLPALSLPHSKVRVREKVPHDAVNPTA
jgi:hypothetical protein